MCVGVDWIQVPPGKGPDVVNMIKFRVPHKAENFMMGLPRWDTLHYVSHVACLAWQNRWMNQRKCDMNRHTVPAIYNKSSFAIITRANSAKQPQQLHNKSNQNSTFSDSPQFLTQLISRIRAV